MLGSLMPEHHKTMWGVLEDIFQNPAVAAWREALLQFAYRHGDYRVLTCDGTMKVPMSLQGYNRRFFRGSSSDLNSAWSREERLTRILTVQGTTGFVLGALLVKDEAGGTVVHALTELVPQDRRQSVRYVVVDWASKELHTAMAAPFPNFQGVCEDPIHIVVRYKSAFGYRPTPGSHRLSRIMAKFSLPRATGTTDEPPVQLWCWIPCAKSAAESSVVARLGKCPLSDDEALEAKHILDREGPFVVFREYLVCMAAQVSEFLQEMMKKVPNSGKKGKGRF